MAREYPFFHRVLNDVQLIRIIELPLNSSIRFWSPGIGLALVGPLFSAWLMAQKADQEITFGN